MNCHESRLVGVLWRKKGFPLWWVLSCQAILRNWEPLTSQICLTRASGPGSLVNRVWTRAPPGKHWRETPVLGQRFWKLKNWLRTTQRGFFCWKYPPAQEVITMATYGKSPNIGGWMRGCVCLYFSAISENIFRFQLPLAQQLRSTLVRIQWG